MDDQRLGEETSGVAGGLHPSELSRQAVLAHPAEACVEISDELLVSDDEDHVASGVGVGAELAAGPGADNDLSVVGDGVRAAEDVVGRGPELAHLAALRRAVERAQLGADRVIAPGLVDRLGDPEFTQRLR